MLMQEHMKVIHLFAAWSCWYLDIFICRLPKLSEMKFICICFNCSLPKSVKRRIKALKKWQFEAAKIEADFYKEVHELECKYASKYTPLYEKVS